MPLSIQRKLRAVFVVAQLSRLLQNWIFRARYTESTLNIFEPRYRAMYNDILFSGGRRFLVMPVTEDGRFAEVGVVFYVSELNDVSDKTNDQVAESAQLPSRPQRVLL